jgi:hypothetical protein
LQEGRKEISKKERGRERYRKKRTKKQKEGNEREK